MSILVILVIYLCFVEKTSAYNSNFTKNCKITEHDQMIKNKTVALVSCKVSNGYTFSYKSFQEWNSKSLLSLTITCVNGGKVVLRRPIIMRGVIKLSIRNCYIKEYYNYDFQSGDRQTLSQLTTLEMIDSVFENNKIDLAKLPMRKKNSLLKERRCFIPTDLEHFILRNATYIVVNDIDVRNINQTMKSEIAKYEKELFSIRCRYHSLKNIEISSCKDEIFAKTLINALVENGIYDRLEFLNFSNNNLRTVPNNLFTSYFSNVMPRKVKVDLSMNRISDLRFLSEASVFEINLSNNQIKEITRAELVILKNLLLYSGVYVDITANPLLCCQTSLKSYMLILKKKSVNNSSEFMTCRLHNENEKYEDFSVTKFLTQKTKCNDPSKQSQPCSDDDEIALKFFNMYKSWIIGSFLGITACIFCFCVLLKFKSRIILMLSVKNSRDCHCFCEVKNFDAFISYSSQDERWVYEVLCEKLQSKSPDINLCLHQKDFVPGACISENIINSVENSRYTLLILSKNFIASEWCHMEFQKAFHQTLKHRRHLLIILKEDIDFDLLDYDLKFFLQTYTYLKYSDVHFWPKLINVLEDQNDSKMPAKMDTSPDSHLLSSCVHV